MTQLPYGSDPASTSDADRYETIISDNDVEPQAYASGTSGSSSTGGASSTTGYAPSYGTTETSSSKTDQAKEQASNVGQSARQAGGQVASTAQDQAKNVAGEAKNQAKSLASQTGSQVNEQAGVQKDRAVTGLRGIGDELRSMSGNSDQSGPATQFAGQAGEYAHNAASWLESRDPSQILDEARDFARRKPGVFLLGAGIAGALAGRLTRGTIQNKKDEAGS